MPSIQTKASSPLCHSSVYPLCNAILLWCLPHRKVPLNSILMAEMHKFLISLLYLVIRPQIFDLSPCTIFYLFLPHFKLGKDFRLVLHEVNPDLIEKYQ